MEERLDESERIVSLAIEHKHHDTAGDIAADKMATYYGSWWFVFVQAALMAIWVTVNTMGRLHIIQFDKFPFVLLNLFMSAEAAFATPVILMASNRSSLQQQTRNEAILAKVQEVLDQQNVVLDHQNDVLAGQNKELARQDMKLLEIQKQLDSFARKVQDHDTQDK